MQLEKTMLFNYLPLMVISFFPCVSHNCTMQESKRLFTLAIFAVIFGVIFNSSDGCERVDEL
jgi:hypothetical protein